MLLLAESNTATLASTTMRALYSRLKKQDSSRKHFQNIVQKRAKSRSVNMDGTNFLQMVLDFLKKYEPLVRTGEKTLVRHQPHSFLSWRMAAGRKSNGVGQLPQLPQKHQPTIPPIPLKFTTHQSEVAASTVHVAVSVFVSLWFNVCQNHLLADFL